MSAINPSQTAVCKIGSVSSAKYKLSLWLGNTYHNMVVINWLWSLCHMSLFTTVTTERAKPGIAPAECTYSIFYSWSYLNRCSDLRRFRLLFRLCNSLKLLHSFFTKGYEKQNQVDSLLWGYFLEAINKYNSSHTPSLSPSEVFLVADWLLMVDAS